MTISSPNTKVEYVASAGQTVFTGTWRITEANQVTVYKNGSKQTMVTHYNITNVGQANFTVTFTAGLTAGDTVSIELDPPFDQLIDYRFNDKFPEESNENGLDKLTLICLSLRDAVSNIVLGDNIDVFEDILNRLDTLEGATNPNAAAGTFLVSGGQVVWQTGLQFLVSAATYFIDGTLYSSAQQTITLNAADGSNPRIDAITLNTSGVVGKVTGTPAANPAEPSVDPATLLKLTIVLVPTGATEPVVTNTSLYAENAGHPAEWNWTATHASINLASTSSPRTGTKCIEGTSVPSGQYAQGKKGAGTIDLNTFDRLILYVRSKGFGNARWINVEWFQDGTKKGNTVLVRNGQWGFNSQNTTDYQVIALETILFSIPSGTLVNEIRLRTTGTIGFRIDDIVLQTGGTSGSTILPIPGISEEDADAKYQPIISPQRTELFTDFIDVVEVVRYQNALESSSKPTSPGQIRRMDGGNNYLRSPATSGFGMFAPTSGVVAEVQIRAYSGSQAQPQTFRIGFATDPVAAQPGNGIYFERLSTDANWFGVCRKDFATQTRADTGSAYVDVGNETDNGWQVFKIILTGTSEAKFYINGTLVATITTNIPTTNQWVWCMFTSTGLNTWWWMDYVWFKLTGINRT